MDRCIRYTDTNLIWTERLGWAVFDAKHLRRLAQFVVNDSSHPKLQRPSAERQISPQRLEKAIKYVGIATDKRARVVTGLYTSSLADAFYIIVAAISDKGHGDVSSLPPIAPMITFVGSISEASRSTAFALHDFHVAGGRRPVSLQPLQAVVGERLLDGDVRAARCAQDQRRNSGARGCGIEWPESPTAILPSPRLAHDDGIPTALRCCSL